MPVSGHLLLVWYFSTENSWVVPRRLADHQLWFFFRTATFPIHFHLSSPFPVLCCCQYRCSQTNAYSNSYCSAKNFGVSVVLRSSIFWLLFTERIDSSSLPLKNFSFPWKKLSTGYLKTGLFVSTKKQQTIPSWFHQKKQTFAADFFMLSKSPRKARLGRTIYVYFCLQTSDFFLWKNASLLIIAVWFLIILLKIASLSLFCHAGPKNT